MRFNLQIVFYRFRKAFRAADYYITKTAAHYVIEENHLKSYINPRRGQKQGAWELSLCLQMNWVTCNQKMKAEGEELIAINI